METMNGPRDWRRMLADADAYLAGIEARMAAVTARRKVADAAAGDRLAA